MSARNINLNPIWKPNQVIIEFEIEIEILADASYDKMFLFSWLNCQIRIEIIELQCNFGFIIITICHQTSIVPWLDSQLMKKLRHIRLKLNPSHILVSCELVLGLSSG